MGATKWDHIRDLFHEARRLEPSDRAAFLTSRCDDGPTRLAVLEMLGASDAHALEIDAKLLATDSAASAGKEIGGLCGPYRILDHIGRGGMADVFLATSLEHPDTRVALKVLRSASGGQDLATRFGLEREILGRLQHPHIARLIDGGATPEGRPYLVLEFVDGWPLLEYANEHRLALPGRLELFLQVCEAVQFAHERDVIHRDLKPSNILVESGHAVLLDFGIAKLLEPLQVGDLAGFVTPAGVRLLTPANAAPEQVKGELPTPQTDVYGLGLILYELLAGKPAFDPYGINWLEWERLVIEVDPPPPSEVILGSGSGTDQLGEQVRARLDRIVLKAIHKDPQRRYASARALADDLREERDALELQSAE